MKIRGNVVYMSRNGNDFRVGTVQMRRNQMFFQVEPYLLLSLEEMQVLTEALKQHKECAVGEALRG